MTGYILPAVLRRADPPPAAALPLVLDSPHSGRDYPGDFGYAAPLAMLRRAEDAFVDELFAGAPAEGAGLLAALFPRSYVDPNRHETDIDPALFDRPFPYEARPTARSARGLGVVRRLVSPELPVYDRPLAPEEVMGRIAQYHRPYHAALAAMIEAAHARFGAVWHVNCHSMRAAGRARNGAGPPRADFVLGDLDGAACDPAFTAIVRRTLEGMGYSVALNHPFKGAELVGRHGRPGAGRHSLQIEVNRRLYLDEARLEKTAGFDRLKADLDALIGALAGWIRAQLGG